MNTTEGFELTVVITAHNRADIIDQTLHSLTQQTWDNGTWTILLVDNDSTDNTPQILRDWAPKMPVPTRILTATNGHSPAYARNAAVAETTTPNIAFIDDDDLIAPGWVAAIGTALRTHQLVGSRYDYHHLNDPHIAAANNFQTTGLSSGYGVPTVSGGGMGCRAALWRQVGGNDEAARFGEDIDFSLRISRLGIEPQFCHDAVYSVRLRRGFRAAFDRGLHVGRASVALHKSHGSTFGSRPDPLSLMVRVWLAYLLRLPTILDRKRRLLWASQLGNRMGRLTGSVELRTWYP